MNVNHEGMEKEGIRFAQIKHEMDAEEGDVGVEVKSRMSYDQWRRNNMEEWPRRRVCLCIE